MAFNIGANDLANAMGTSVGSKALTPKRAVLLAAILNFSGAVLVGSRVTETVRKGIIDLDSIGSGDPNWTILIGMLAALLSAALWVTLATFFKMPVSTTHSIVGAMAGFGIAAGGLAVVNWDVMGKIAASWIISPLAGAVLAFIAFTLLRKRILNHDHPFDQALRYAPWLVGIVFGVLAIAMFEEAFEALELGFSGYEVMLIGLLVGLISAIPAHFLFQRYRQIEGDEYDKVERIFVFLQIVTAGYVAFAAGSNDVANAIGPVAGIVSELAYGGMGALPSSTAIGLLVLGGIGIAFGISIWGRGVMETIGKKITQITPTRGFTAEFAAATTVLGCSMLGLPISTTHTLVGAVIGVGLAGGVAAVDSRVIRRIFISWGVTVPVAAGTCMLIFLALSVFV
jgi:PiT family inorganic phosphate transporter